MRKLLFIVMMLALVPFSVAGQATEISTELDAELDSIEAWVEDVRGLEPTEPVIRVFPSRETVTDFLYTEITEQLPAETVREAMAFYVAFDFMSPDVDIPSIYLDLIADQIAGYYNPDDKTMNTILISGGELGDSLPALEQVIYAHEFVHALQDQVYGLEEIGLSEEGLETLSTDQIIALQGLIEGDATVVMSLYMEDLISRNPFAAVGLLSGSLASGSMAPPPGTPPILMQELLFPYNQGAIFVTDLINEGGWEAVDAAFADLPQSSEHLLHPESYLTGDDPVPVTVADAALALGTGWEAVTEDTLGEFFLREYLAHQLEREQAYPAAAGWGGDQYRVYQDADGQTAYALRLVWDTPAEATEFATAFETFASLRAGGNAPDAGCWVAADALCFATPDATTTLITLAPTQAGSQALLAAS